MARLASLIGLNHAASHALTDDPRYTAAEIPPPVLVPLTELASRGIDCHDWFAGPRSSQLSDPTLRVSYRQAASMVMRRVLQALGEPDLGLNVDRSATMGVTAMSMRSPGLSTISALYSDDGNRRNAIDAKARVFRSLGGNPLRA